MEEKLQKKDDFYQKLFDENFEDIYKYCWRLVKWQREFQDFVEECSQETFLQALKHLPKLKKHPNVKGWLYTTARNLINNSYRNMYIRKRHEFFFNDNAPQFLATSDDGMDKIFEDKIDIDKLCIDILDNLDKREYDLYIDYFKNKISVFELSLKYNISATAVTTRIYRLKRKIKKIAKEALNKEYEKIF